MKNEEPFLRGIVDRRLSQKTEVERIEALEKKVAELEKKLKSRSNAEYVQEIYNRFSGQERGE